MSLSGEATLYPRLGEMFAEIRRRGAVSFLVTNGLNPSALRDLKETGLPTQLVISCNAPNEELFLRWHRSSVRDAWIKFGESLDVMKSLKGATRRVVRLTLVKAGTEGEFGSMTNMSKVNLDEYVELIKRAEPDFVHVKGYKAVGFAKERMGYNNQVWHEEVLSFSKRICKKLGSTSGHDSSEPDFEVGAEDDRSCVVALKRIGVEMDIEEV
jgi:tRNA wybutosine-synthesizing protein 1